MRVMIFLISIWFTGAHKLHLADDLRSARTRLKGHGAIFSDADFRHLQVFDQYANMDLSGFKCNTKKQGCHVIKKWYGKKGLEIYQVESTFPADSISIIKNVSNGVIDTIKLKPYDVFFRTYIIKPANHPQLIYTTRLDGDLHYFKISKKEFAPVYEDIALGIRYPDEKEILRLIKDI